MYVTGKRKRVYIYIHKYFNKHQKRSWNTVSARSSVRPYESLELRDYNSYQILYEYVLLLHAYS